jgi:hypothetical protein
MFIKSAWPFDFSYLYDSGRTARTEYKICRTSIYLLVRLRTTRRAVNATSGWRKYGFYWSPRGVGDAVRAYLGQTFSGLHALVPRGRANVRRFRGRQTFSGARARRPKDIPSGCRSERVRVRTGNGPRATNVRPGNREQLKAVLPHCSNATPCDFA